MTTVNRVFFRSVFKGNVVSFVLVAVLLSAITFACMYGLYYHLSIEWDTFLKKTSFGFLVLVFAVFPVLLMFLLLYIPCTYEYDESDALTGIIGNVSRTIQRIFCFYVAWLTICFNIFYTTSFFFDIPLYIRAVLVASILLLFLPWTLVHLAKDYKKVLVIDIKQMG